MANRHVVPSCEAVVHGLAGRVVQRWVHGSSCGASRTLWGFVTQGGAAMSPWLGPCHPSLLTMASRGRMDI